MKDNRNWIMGIDEAGRGSVLGPMIYGACWMVEGKEDEVKELGFKDSKKLTEKKREELWETIKKTRYLRWLVESISAEEISAEMLKEGGKNLNSIALHTVGKLIWRARRQGYRIKKVIVDAIGNTTSLRRAIEMVFVDLEVIVESKADDTYPIVSAASICAKETRELEMREWAHEEMKRGWKEKGKMGSGYPADRRTKTWLKANIDVVFGYPKVCRFSWSTVKRILNSEAIEITWGKRLPLLKAMDSKRFVREYKKRVCGTFQAEKEDLWD